MSIPLKNIQQLSHEATGLIFRLLTMVITLHLILGCTGADFSSQTKQKPETINPQCASDGSYINELRVEVGSDPGSEIIVDGEYCPQIPGKLNLMFLIDFSLSMANDKEKRGNDQLVSGSCGRLKAARAILSKHKSILRDAKAEIDVSYVSFSDGVVDEIPLTPISEIDEYINAKTFCRGINNTNYKAAIDATTKLLKDGQGTNLVYLISDGLPTLGGDGKKDVSEIHRRAAIDAKDELKAAVDNVVLSSVFLGEREEFRNLYGFDPMEFLSEISDGENNVRFIDRAENLAQGILDIKKPAINLNTKTAKGTITLKDGKTQSIRIREFKPHASRQQVWTFITEPFPAYQQSNLNSEFAISADDEQGNEFAIKFSIVKKP